MAGQPNLFAEAIDRVRRARGIDTSVHEAGRTSNEHEESLNEVLDEDEANGGDTDIEILVTVGPITGEAAAATDQHRRATRVVVCEDAAAASEVLASILKSGDTVWVKASRVMELDRVVKDLAVRLDQSAAVA